MAERILVDVNEIQTARTQYAAARSKKVTAIEAMNTAVNALKGEWEGDAAEQFRSTFSQLYSNLMSSDVIMEDAISELEKVIQNTVQTENMDVQVGAINLDVGNNYYA